MNQKQEAEDNSVLQQLLSTDPQIAKYDPEFDDALRSFVKFCRRKGIDYFHTAALLTYARFHGLTIGSRSPNSLGKSLQQTDLQKYGVTSGPKKSNRRIYYIQPEN